MNDKAAFETITFGAWLVYWFETFKKPIIKPNSARNILLTDEVETILNGQKKQNEERGIKGRRVFPYSAQQASRHFKTLCPNHHLHELRHTFITRCAESGVNVNVCQQLVGHASADMTINVYTHVMDEFKRKEAAKFSLFPTF